MIKIRLSKVRAFAPIFILGFIMISFNINTVGALSGSYSYSVKGSNIYLVPSFSADTEYYRWVIEKSDGLSNAGATAWIFHNYTFVQQFTLDYAAEYQITLEVKDISGSIEKYSKTITTSRSSLSVQEQRTLQTDTTTDIGRENLVDSFMSFFNGFSPLEKLGFIAISIFVGIFLIDTVFNISGKKKTALYRVVYRRK